VFKPVESHSDVITKEGLFPGISYPRVPGHEVAGVIDVVGTDVKDWKEGERVGVGWHGGQDGTCHFTVDVLCEVREAK
jgi:D-arabinose 1-dehydrogenase-like Zn-dependent alcohol dehydrogenase